MDCVKLESLLLTGSFTPCRLCLCDASFQQVSIYDTHEKLFFAKIISDCIGIKIRRNDGLTQNICTGCRNELVKLYDIRKRCFQADRILREIRSKNQSLKLHRIKTPNGSLDPCNEQDEHNRTTSDDENLTKVKLKETTWKEDGDRKTPNGNHNVVKDCQQLANIFPETDQANDRTTGSSRCKLDAVEGKTDTIPNPIICCGCNPSPKFNSNKELDAHCEEHHKKYRISDNSIRPYECDTCFQRFLTDSLLKHHKERSYRKRPYVCGCCTSAFFTNSALKRHEKICNVVGKDYTCEECGKRFRQIMTLKNHRKLHETKKTFACSVCGKTFKQKFEITIHMVTHTGEQPYPCDQCPVRFKRKQALKNHQRHHLNPQPFKCDLCDGWFGNSAARKYHRLTVHEGLDPFRCDQCGVSYRRRLRLTQHRKKIHGEDL